MIQDYSAYLTSLDSLIERSVHPDDVMFREKTTEDQYFRVGRQAAGLMSVALFNRFSITGKQTAPSRILDFGCGYGRVTRFMRAMFPEAEVVAADVLKDGVAFCEKTLGCTPYYSKATLSELDLPGTFDLIYVGSVFTHLSEDLSRQLLNILSDALNPDGVLIFTLHGRKVLERISSGKQHNPLGDKTLSAFSDYFEKGFGYADYRKQYYDEPVGYGTSLTHVSWTFREIAKRTDTTLAGYQERGWNNHQDVAIVLKRGL